MSQFSYEKLEESLKKFTAWLESYGFESYDQFDFWATPIGIFGKKLFLKNKMVAAPIVIPLQISESFLPGIRKLFAKKQRFAIGDAHFALGFLNLYKYYENKKYLNIARGLLDELLKYYTKSSAGIGWGYPYIWATQYIIHERAAPLITVTPYVFDAFLQFYELTGDGKYLKILEKIAHFAAYDINETRVSEEIIASSYGCEDKSMVINAVAYRAALLLKAYQVFSIDEYKEKAEKNVNFVLASQNSEGYWFYAHDSKFIDNFHTCFVLNQLYESYLILKEERVLDSIKKGYSFYRNNFIRKDGTLIHFYKMRYPKFRKIEVYDYAEGISLGVLLEDDIEGALELSKKLADDLVDKFQLSKGYFITRISILGTKNKIPYLRWPQAQLFFALTRLLRENKNNK